MARDKAAAQKSEESWKKYMAEKGEGGGLVFGGEEGGRGNGDNALHNTLPSTNVLLFALLVHVDRTESWHDSCVMTSTLVNHTTLC